MGRARPSDLVCLNGKLLPAAEVPCPQADLGWLRGYGVYETLHVYPRGVFEVESHLDRLRESAALLRIPMPDRSSLKKGLDLWRKATGVERGRARIVLLPGEPKGSWWMVEGETMAKRPPLEDRGLKIWVSALTVPPPPLGIAKTISRVAYELAAIEAKEHGTDDAVLPTIHGKLGESTRASVFLVHRGKLMTPPLSLGILPGVTRSILLEMLPGRGVPVLERTVPIDRIYEADEAFVTSTVRGVAPIIELRGPGGKRRKLPIGPAARAAEAALVERVRQSGLDPGSP